MKATRIDLAVTVWLEPPEAGLAERGKRDGRGWAATAKNPCRHDYYDAADGNGTLYVGSWHSQQFARLYDRGAKTHVESDAGAWRYEVVTKDLGAVAHCERLVGVADTRDYIRRAVYTFFATRGVSPTFECGSLGVYTNPEAEPTSDARRLAWLREQVSPSVAELVKRRGLSIVLDALGLDAATCYNGAEDRDRAREPRWTPRLEHNLWRGWSPPAAPAPPLR